MMLSKEEREVLMNEKIYVHLEQIKPNQFFYGIMSVIDEKPFDYEIGKINGLREDVLDKISKKIITDNSVNLNNNVFNLKYTELNDAKIMARRITSDDFYKDFRVTTTPAIFLSDMHNVNILTNMVQKNNLQNQIIQNAKYGFVR